MSVERKLNESDAAISIQFGTSGGNLIANDVCVEIGEVNITKITNAKARLEHAIETGNYTITLKDESDGYSGTGYYGTFKFFNNACLFEYGNTYDSTSGSYGFAENGEGIFKYSLSSTGEVNPNTDYIKVNGENVKGLYTTNEVIHLTSFEGDSKGNICEGIPSLNKIDLSKFDFDMVIGDTKSITDGISLRYLSYMLDDMFSQNYYSGISKASVLLDSNDNLVISFKNKYSYAPATFIISDIGATTHEAVENFIASDWFGPAAKVEEAPADENVTAMLTSIAMGNYTVTKEDGTKFYMNSNYSYMETKNSETNEVTVRGYIKLGPSMFSYVIENNEISVDTSFDYSGIYGSLSSISGLDGINSGNVQYFLTKNANKFTYSEENNRYELVTSDASYIYFANKWYNFEASGCNVVTLEKNNDNIIIGMDLLSEGSTNSTYKTIDISNIGATTVQLLDDYIASMDEA